MTMDNRRAASSGSSGTGSNIRGEASGRATAQRGEPRKPLPPSTGSQARTQSGGKKRKPGMKNKAGKVVTAATVLILAGGAAFVGLKLNNIAGGKDSGGLPSMVASVRDPRAKFPGKNRVTVLLLGKDYNRDKKGMPYTTGARADSIMLLSLDLEKEKVSALSIPRDTRVTAPDGKTSKINATYARGGAKLISETVSELLGVTPDYTIALKPDAVKALVDALGGVEVESIDAMNYDDEWGQLHVHLPAGVQTVDGEQAVGFARFREVKPGVPHSKEEGDPRRMARQQQLIRAMVAKAKSFSNLLQVDTIVNTGFDQVETDLTRQQVFALASLFRTFKPDQMQAASLPGHGKRYGPHGTYFFMPDPRKKEALVNWLLKGDEQAANALTSVAVQNGTDVPGAAKQVADMLKAKGFDAKSAGNVPQSPSGEAGAENGEVTETRIVYGKAAVASRAEKIAEMLGGGKVIKEVKPVVEGASVPSGNEDDADVTVVLGRDLASSFIKRSAQR